MNIHMHAIIISLICSFIVALSLFVYTYIYPKKPMHPLIILLLVSLLPLISIFKAGTYESGDLSTHIKFSIAFYQSLSEGNILPRWAITCGGYGCPHFIFLYILPYYFVSFFHFLGLSFIASAKAFLIAAFIASGITMYLYLKEFFGKTAGFIGGVFYLFSPYHLVDLHFRNAFGELLSFVFIPLIFFFSQKILNTNKFVYVVLTSICLSLLLLSHEVIFISIVPLLFVYIVFLTISTHKTTKGFMLFLVSLLFSLLLSSFYWTPILLEAKYTKYGISSGISFLKLKDILFSEWRYGFLFQGPQGHLSFLIGYIQLGILVLALIFIIRNKVKKTKNILIFFFISLIIYLFLTQAASQPIWTTIPLLDKFQSTYRLMVAVSFCISILSAILLKSLNKKILVLICIVVIGSTILNWSNRRTISDIGDEYLQRELLNGEPSGHDLPTPVWVDVHASWSLIKPKTNLEVLEGEAVVKEIFRTTTKHSYIVDGEADSVLKENTFYFPGWNVEINNKKVPIDFTNKTYPGLITFKTEKGLNLVDISYKDIPLQTFANFISIITLALLLFLVKYAKMSGKQVRKRN